MPRRSLAGIVTWNFGFMVTNGMAGLGCTSWKLQLMYHRVSEHTSPRRQAKRLWRLVATRRSPAMPTPMDSNSLDATSNAPDGWRRTGGRHDRNIHAMGCHGPATDLGGYASLSGSMRRGGSGGRQPDPRRAERHRPGGQHEPVGARNRDEPRGALQGVVGGRQPDLRHGDAHHAGVGIAVANHGNAINEDAPASAGTRPPARTRHRSHG